MRQLTGRRNGAEINPKKFAVKYSKKIKGSETDKREKEDR
jgi:hypothetical protein